MFVDDGTKLEAYFDNVELGIDDRSIFFVSIVFVEVEVEDVSDEPNNHCQKVNPFFVDGEVELSAFL